MLDTRLFAVSKPARYIDNEIHSVKKPLPGDFLRFCLAFPDVYEIGMSHIGFKMLYERLNASKHIYAERFFAPWPDAIEVFGKDIFAGLESGTPLAEYDVVGFSMQYELSYTTMLACLHRAEIPMRTVDRGEKDPLIFAGGSCILNPAPLSAFVDVFFMGEMDTALTPLMEKLYAARKNGATRKEQLELLDTAPFTYIPSLNRNKKAVREIYAEFAQDITLQKLPVPLMPAIQDRVAVEISRGCSRGCRFCQAGMVYRPVRERSVDTLLKDALGQVKSSGYCEVSLLSLSAGDYSDLEHLMMSMADTFRESRVGLALPSLRADKITTRMFEEISKVRKSGFTIAPEAGSQRMRDVINKNLSEEEIIRAVKLAADAGWNGAKLYFMIGLPFETMEDVEEIARLAGRVRRSLPRQRSFNITVSVSNFVPKAHTPFQWWPQDTPEMLSAKRKILFEAFRKEKVMGKFHNVHMSTMEAVFSRGDERLAVILEGAVKKGIYLDAWSEHFEMDNWRAVFNDAGLSMSDFAQAEWGLDDALPWEQVSVGIDKSFFVDEYKKAQEVSVTPDCRVAGCTACGLCDFDTIKNVDAESGRGAAEPFVRAVGEKKEYYAVQFDKKGVGKYLAAIETGRVFMHALFIAGVDLAFSQGFNPHPKLTYHIPLSVGVEGEREVLFIQAAPIADIAATITTLNEALPEGMQVYSITPCETPKLSQESTLVYRLAEAGWNCIQDAVREERAYYEKTDKKGRPKRVSLTDFLISMEDGVIAIATREEGTFNLMEFFRNNGISPDAAGIVRINAGIAWQEKQEKVADA